MKKLLILLLALMLCGAALAEEAAYPFREGITWGMTQSDVLGVEGAENVEAGSDGAMAVLEVDDVSFRGYEADLQYLFWSDFLAMAVYELEVEDVTPEALIEQLDGEYGEHVVDKGKAYFDALSRLTGILYYAQPELEGVNATWTLPDGTLAMVLTGLDATTDDYVVVYLCAGGGFAPLGGDLSEPAPAIEEP